LTERSKGKTSSYVFPARHEKTKNGFVGDAKTTMEEVSKISGLHLTHHDMRRTFQAIGIKNNIEMWKLKLLTNHVIQNDVTITNYTETSDLTYLSGESETIAAWIIKQGKIANRMNVIQIKVA
jgi:hypothetical protein